MNRFEFLCLNTTIMVLGTVSFFSIISNQLGEKYGPLIVLLAIVCLCLSAVGFVIYTLVEGIKNIRKKGE